MCVRMLFLVVILPAWIDAVYGQIGVTTCTFATQALCPANIPLSYCELANGFCQCAAAAGYVNDGTGAACIYDCGTLTAPTNGKVPTYTSTRTGGVATYSCNNGYKIAGTATLTCVHDVGWDGTSPTCTEGVLGDSCAERVFLCINIAFGTCKDFTTCECQAGFEDDGTGNDCKEINECTTMTPCKNGGTCIDSINSYTCTCVAGYTDNNCSTNINECASSPCQNGATCNDGVNGYTCTCAPGYTGTICSTNINECASTPCQNGGTCRDGVNRYTCACIAGYVDANCATNFDECVDNNCKNGAICVDAISSYSCVCQQGYDGIFCTNNINECINHTCQNGATCVDGTNGYNCSCLPGFNGNMCQLNIDECASNGCTNEAACVDEINKYTCTCVARYTGTLCDSNINECASGPCQINATCVDLVNDYTCNCVDGYTGKNCPTDCGVLTAPTNGLLDQSQGTKYLANAVFSCNKGYTLVGSSTRTCQASGVWSTVNPICQIKDCAVLQDPPNGDVNILSETVFRGGVATYSCIAGYDIQGITQRTCQSSGNWSSVPPTYERRSNSPKVCNENKDERGTVWPETFAGNTLVKSCNETFTGNVSRACSSDAKWTLPKYNCLRSTVVDATTKVFGLSTQSTDVEIVAAVKQLFEAAKQATASDVLSRATDAEVFELSTALNFVAELIPADSLSATNDFIDSASSLVDQQHQNSWKTLEYWDSFGADYVIDAVEKVANKSTLIDHSIVTTNIAYKKQNTSIKDVSFPRESDGGWLEESRSSIYVSFSSILDSSEEVTSFGLIYKNLTGILRASGGADIGAGADIVNGPVVSLTLVSSPTNPVTQVTVVIEHSVKTGYSMPRCSFWKFGTDNSRGSWSMEGCVVASSNATVTVCTCDHLTNFAVLMSPFVQVDMTSEILRVASIVGMCISLLFLLITLLTHCCLYRYLRSDRVTHLINFCTALFVSYVIFLTGIDKTESRDICIFITSVLHYIYLVVFFLMLVGGIDVCYSVTFIFSKRLRMRCLLLAAWVLPAVIVGISLGITKTKGYGNSSFCWLSLEEGLIWAFVGPALTVIALNVLFLAITIYKLFQARTMKEKSKLDQIKTTVRALCVLVPVMGISWIVGIFYVHKELYWIQFVFAICNSLQGIFVFLFHCVFNTQVKNAMKAKARKYSSSKMTSELKLSQRNNSGSSPRANLREPSNDEFQSQPVGQKRCLPGRHYKY